MKRRLIVVGDVTSHGGTVVSGSPMFTIGGKPIARLGDQVACPAHGTSKIIEGAESYAVGGLPAALEGHRTECGATLIGSCESSVHDA